MSQRSIEETFRAIQPKGWAGIPEPPTIAVGTGGSSGDLSTALSQAGQQIAQLQAAYKQQGDLISANTQAIQGNTSAQSGHSAGSTAASVGSSFLGGALGLLSPLVSGIASLFGGGSSTPAALPVYVPPPSVSIDSTLRSAVPASAAPATQSNPASLAAPVTPATQSNPTMNVTVNVNAMDSQSFMDRSSDIASAVRAAMLNLHPINDVVASL